MKIDFIADSNILIYILEGNSVIKSFMDYNFGISIISEIELLGYKNLTKEEENLINSLIDDCFVFGVDENVKKNTIKLRKKYSLKLPDAIIAATSMTFSIPLLTADKIFSQISECDIVILEMNQDIRY